MPLLEINFKGRIDSDLSEWFQGMTVQALSPDESCLSGEVADNSAIYGVLSTLSSLGITLLSVFVSDATENAASKK